MPCFLSPQHLVSFLAFGLRRSDSDDLAERRWTGSTTLSPISSPSLDSGGLDLLICISSILSVSGGLDLLSSVSESTLVKVNLSCFCSPVDWIIADDLFGHIYPAFFAHLVYVFICSALPPYTSFLVYPPSMDLPSSMH